MVRSEDNDCSPQVGIVEHLSREKRHLLSLMRLTPRLSCGARAQPPSRRRPPARRQLQPVVRRRRCHLALESGTMFVSIIASDHTETQSDLHVCSARPGQLWGLEGGTKQEMRLA